RIGGKVESSCSNGSCRANPLRVREAAGLCLTEATHSPGLRVPPHAHEKTHFCLLLQGVYEEKWGRDIFVRKPGTLALAAGGGVHSNRIHSSGIRFFSIEMTQPWLDRANGHLKHFQGLTQFDNGSLPWLAMRIYREFTSPDDLSPLAIEGLALELLAGAARHNGSSPDDQGSNWLNKARELLRERFRESITLPELAKVADVHP